MKSAIGCKIKIHKRESNSCCRQMLCHLLGLTDTDAATLIVEYRKLRNLNKFVPSLFTDYELHEGWERDHGSMFHPEIEDILAMVKKWDVKFRWYKHTEKVKFHCLKLDKQSTYLVAIKGHIMILHKGRLYDNETHRHPRGLGISNHKWSRWPVIACAKIKAA